ncbi:MAG: hypothetical protein GY732_07695 [Gammaproteobacteria bacterium]|nr:hypothetical protein [Gammaproteobacteria bacterium]
MYVVNITLSWLFLDVPLVGGVAGMQIRMSVLFREQQFNLSAQPVAITW